MIKYIVITISIIIDIIFIYYFCKGLYIGIKHKRNIKK